MPRWLSAGNAVDMVPAFAAQLAGLRPSRGIPTSSVGISTERSTAGREIEIVNSRRSSLCITVDAAIDATGVETDPRIGGGFVDDGH